MPGSESRIGVAVTGASGVRVGIRVLEYLSSRGYSVDAVVSEGAFRVARLEDDLTKNELLEKLYKLRINVYDENDFTSPLASSSSVPRTFIIVPASMKTLAALAMGLAENLVVRAALATLRIGGRLVVAPRETPISQIDIENMLRLSKAGAMIVPLCVGFYHKPKNIGDIVDFLAGKVLDAAGVQNSLYRRWSSHS